MVPHRALPHDPIWQGFVAVATLFPFPVATSGQGPKVRCRRSGLTRSAHMDYLNETSRYDGDTGHSSEDQVGKDGMP
jgi:hypothetical protein